MSICSQCNVMDHLYYTFQLTPRAKIRNSRAGNQVLSPRDRVSHWEVCGRACVPTQENGKFWCILRANFYFS